MNKTIKKMVAGLGAAFAFAMCLAPVSAAGSITSNGTVTGGILVNGQVVEGATGSFSSDFSAVADEKVLDAIAGLNKGTSLKEALFGVDVAMAKDVKIDLADYALLTQVQDLTVSGVEEAKDVTVSWEVPNLTSKDAYVLHYSTARSTWEVLSPEEVNTTDKTITCTFADLSPVAVIYNVNGAAKEDGKVNTSTSTNTTLYIGLAAVAVVVGGALIIFSKKSRA